MQDVGPATTPIRLHAYSMEAAGAKGRKGGGEGCLDCRLTPSHLSSLPVRHGRKERRRKGHPNAPAPAADVVRQTGGGKKREKEEPGPRPPCPRRPGHRHAVRSPWARISRKKRKRKEGTLAASLMATPYRGSPAAGAQGKEKSGPGKLRMVMTGSRTPSCFSERKKKEGDEGG